MNQALVHDAAFGLAQDILYVFANLIMEGEKVEAFTEVYTRSKERLEQFEKAVQRRANRLNPVPSDN